MSQVHAWTGRYVAGTDSVLMHAPCGAQVPLIRSTANPKRWTCLRCIGRPYVVFCATQTTLVWARNVDHAFSQYVDEWRRWRPVAIPTRREVRVRRLTPGDVGWVESQLEQVGKREQKRWRDAIERLRSAA